MPKKPARNGFWYFMSEWKTIQEAKGRTFPNGFRDVQEDPECSRAWGELKPDDKLVYTNRAKKAKNQPLRGKKTGTGESQDFIKLEEQEAQDFIQIMEAYIRLTVSTAKRLRSLHSLSFPFIHVNVYYMRTPDNSPVDFCPAEFAIGEFSIENGISRYYHEIIKTDLHLGYAREAIETSEKTHKLRWDLPIGEGDWAIIYHNMMTFLEPMQINGELPPIYTMQKYSHILPSLFRRMTAAVGQTPEKFKVYSLESLFGHMLRAVNDHPESNAVAIIAETQLSKELFAYTPDIECEYHKLFDGTGRFCSLSVIRQWAFEFCDRCCKPLEIDMIPGVHCPEILDVKFKGNNRCSSLSSLLSDRTLSVLSATGVSEQHRLSVSERSRDEDERRRRGNGHVEIIDHSLLKKEKDPPAPPPVSVAVEVVAQPLRAPVTASQALMGVARLPPALNSENFPAIGGRGAPIRRDNRVDSRRMTDPIWSHRGRKNSDSD